MTSIDDLFRKPLTTSSSNPAKRKLSPIRDPSQVYKSAKHQTNGDVKNKTHVEDVPVEDDDDVEAGPALPPDEDDEQDDEEGRFFGGGVSRDTADALNYVEEHEGEAEDSGDLDAAWVRRQATTFARRIAKNAEMRAKFEDDPQKFMASEADLDASIKEWVELSDWPQLYGEFAKAGAAASLVSLLAHENTDIAIGAVEVMAQLVHEDVEGKPEDFDEANRAMLEADLPDLLVQNLERLDESNEVDKEGVYDSLTVMQSLASQADRVKNTVDQSSILKWLLKRAEREETKVSQNKQYAAEVLAIYLQSSEPIRALVLGLDAIDALLQVVARYRKHDPEKDSDEEEYVANVFDSLVCLVQSEDGKSKFIEAEGVELALIMLREGKFSKPRALRVLDHAIGGIAGAAVCKRVIEAAGLKTIFGMFMKKMDQGTTEHVLGMFASMLRLLPGETASRIRLLAKFMEKDYEKVQKLVKIRQDYAQRLKPVEEAIGKERSALSDDDQEAMADMFLSRRLDAGLYTLQTVNVVLAWLGAEDDGAKKCISDLLAKHDEGLVDVKATLSEQLADIEASTEAQNEERANAADMLRTLIDCIS